MRVHRPRVAPSDVTEPSEVAEAGARWPMGSEAPHWEKDLGEGRGGDC